MSERPRKIFFVAGESSGDQPAGKVIRRMLELRPDWQVAGLGGPEMEAAGMQLLRNMVNDLAIVGLVEVISKAPKIFRVYRMVRRWLRRERPDAVVLVDYPGFNLKLIAPLAQELGIPVIYYIVPQFWAWGSGRIEKFKECCDKLIPILPFEERRLREHGIDARYLGHPKLDLIVATQSREDVFETYGFDPEKKLIGLLPGSRKGEVKAHLPIMLEAVRRLVDLRDDLQFVLLRAETIPIDLIDTYLDQYPAPVRLIDQSLGNRYNIRAAFDFSWVKSGTSTLEGSLLGVPFVILYKVNYITAWIAKRVITTPYLGLPNNIAEDLVVPELLQEEATGQNLVDLTRHYLNDAEAYETMRYRLQKIREMFGPPGSDERVAKEIVEFVDGGECALKSADDSAGA